MDAPSSPLASAAKRPREAREREKEHICEARLIIWLGAFQVRPRGRRPSVNLAAFLPN